MLHSLWYLLMCFKLVTLMCCQERAALMSEVDAMRADLAAAQERCSAAELRVSEAQGRVNQLEGELNDARREVRVLSEVLTRSAQSWLAHAGPVVAQHPGHLLLIWPLGIVLGGSVARVYGARAFSHAHSCFFWCMHATNDVLACV